MDVPVAPPAPPATEEQKAKAREERDGITRALWRELHTAALAGKLTPQWIGAFGPRIPCGDCRKHWGELLKEIPPVFGAGSFAWTVIVHNTVNLRLGKSEWTVDEARKLYS